MKLFYFAHPYSAQMFSDQKDYRAQEANFRLCCVRTAELILQGHNIFSPICHSHPIQCAHPLLQDARWYELDNHMIRHVNWDGIILAPHWQVSFGCVAERHLFEHDLKLPVFYYEGVLAHSVDRLWRICPDCENSDCQCGTVPLRDTNSSEDR